MTRLLLIVGRFLGVLVVMYLPAGPAAAQSDRAARFGQAFFGWAADQGVTDAAIAVTREGQVVLERALGRDAGVPRELASLSKAITAVCLADLVDAGRLRWDDDMTALLRWDGPAAGVTVAQLVTHAGGITPDHTQTTMPLTLDRAQPRWPRVASVVERRRLGAPGYRYNNENYAVLGVVIEAVTGLPYAQACAQGLADYPTVQASPRTGAFLPWGGWQMSVGDYARFHATRFAGRAPQGPVADIDGPVVYGLGMTHRAIGAHWSSWHFGLNCFPGRLERGAFSASWPGIWGVTVAFDRCPDWSAMIDLDRRLVEVLLSDD